MDLIIARRGTVAIALNTMLTDSAGAVVPPDISTTVVASLYRDDPATGTLALDVVLGTSGNLTLANLFALPGFYGASLNIVGALFDRYTVVITWTASSIQRRKLMRLFISEDLKTINRGANITPSSRDTLVTGT